MPNFQPAVPLVKESEGCELTAYPDPGTGGEPWTIGFGHTGEVNGVPVHPGMTITQAQADALLQADMAEVAKEVNDMCAITLNPNQFSALVSFAYNVGTGALKDSTLMHLVNQGEFSAAASQFQYWVYADGEALPGLVTRRAAEAALFRKPV